MKKLLVLTLIAGLLSACNYTVKKDKTKAIGGSAVNGGQHTKQTPKYGAKKGSVKP